MTNPTDQVLHGLEYMRARYGNLMPEEAFNPNHAHHNDWVEVAGKCIADHDHGLKYD